MLSLWLVLPRFTGWLNRTGNELCSAHMLFDCLTDCRKFSRCCRCCCVQDVAVDKHARFNGSVCFTVLYHPVNKLCQCYSPLKWILHIWHGQFCTMRDTVPCWALTEPAVSSAYTPLYWSADFTSSTPTVLMYRSDLCLFWGQVRSSEMLLSRVMDEAFT